MKLCQSDENLQLPLAIVDHSLKGGHATKTEKSGD